MTSTETTADYARVLFNGEQDEQQAASSSGEQPTAPQQDTSKQGKTKTRKEKTPSSKPEAGKGAATSWTPGDYAAVAPSTLAESVAAHRDRYQAIGNPAAKVLYGLYTTVAVPTSIVLNLLSLVAAHASVAINEPSRIRHALLGLVFLAVIVGGVVWAGA